MYNEFMFDISVNGVVKMLIEIVMIISILPGCLNLSLRTVGQVFRVGKSGLNQEEEAVTLCRSIS